jgi:hypothetical protein
MTKVEELEKAVQMLEQRVEANKTMNTEYESDLVRAKKDLADFNKPMLTEAQFDLVWMAIEKGVGEYDFSDSDNFDKEFGIDYDGRVTLESFDINNSQSLVEAIAAEVNNQFAEYKEPIVEEIEQPIETQSVLLDPMPPAEPRESETADAKPSNEDMENLKQMAEEKKQNKEEKTFEKRSWFNK